MQVCAAVPQLLLLPGKAREIKISAAAAAVVVEGQHHHAYSTSSQLVFV
jgi:hypothetical protein